jgi:Replication-relaxation
MCCKLTIGTLGHTSSKGSRGWVTKSQDRRSARPQSKKSTPPAFYFTDSDAEIVKWLAAYHYLQPIHFQKLIGRNMVSLRHRLRQLHQQGQVERLTLPLERELLIPNPPDQYVYFLSRKGVGLAQQLGYADEKHRYNSEKSTRLLTHDLAISSFHLTLELATRGTSLELVFWERRRGQLQDWAELAGERLSVNPDALFGIKNQDKPTDRSASYFFLELALARESDC